ncbi:c6 zinc finger domain-containing protein [Diplodia corticola]|uniref:C6 zinc finger domain-containing protein n=1 Tax=Diplodia corticola TaxID=236234 RepID=A0A1J9QKY0_9PEZI|nr:c6 zinc finger domain-containing protein [Diplodia corticola]OJD28722.1 c6 zinc finger domain-containing protein [Diplodia corticola]
MFTMLRYSPESDLLHERCDRPPKTASTGILRLACMYCRAKKVSRPGFQPPAVDSDTSKLRCSGDKPSCQRCVSKRLDCTYPTRGARSGGARKDAVHREEQKPVAVDQNCSPNKGSTPDSTARSNDFWNHSTFSECDTSQDTFPTTVDENQLFDAVLASDNDSFREASPSKAAASKPPGPGSDSPKATLGASMNDEVVCSASSRPGDEAVAEGTGTREAVPQGPSAEEAAEEGDLDLYISTWESLIGWDDSALADAWLVEGSAPPGSGVLAVPQHSTNTSTDVSRPSSVASTSCNCIIRAIASVEKFEPSDTAAPTETTLAAYKTAIVDCEKLLSCAHCHASTSATMLVIMVSDKLIASHQRLYARGSGPWTSESPADQAPFDDGAAGAAAAAAATAAAAAADGGDQQPPRRMSLGEYPIDCEREWGHIMELLIYLQLTRIRDLLERLRVRVLSTDDQLQTQIIQQQEARLRHIIAHFQRTAKIFIP